MTWKEFIQPIKKSQLASGSQEKILILIFESAGYINKKEDGISEETVKKWICGTRNCNAFSYFPEGKLTNPEGVYKFFRRRSADKLQKLQQIFCKEKDDSSPIDCKTKDMDVFCWSLVNQFLDLLGLQRLDMPALEAGQNSEVNFSIVENEIDRNADGEQSSIAFQKEALYQEEDGIGFPDECRICRYCQNWSGNVINAFKSIDKEYGECKVLGKKVLAESGINCVEFKEDYSKAALYCMTHKPLEKGILEAFRK